MAKPRLILLRFIKQFSSSAVLIALGLSLVSCGAENAKSRYLLAEKLYLENKFEASLAQFERVIRKEPHSKLGLQALFRAATIQSLYLNQQTEAVQKFREFVEWSKDAPVVWEAQKQIGDILFVRLEQYEPVILHYRNMLKQRPAAEEAPEILYRVARSHFFQQQFEDALQDYEELIKTYANSKWAEQALFQVGVTHFTKAGQGAADSESANESIQEALDAYQRFIKRYPKSGLVSEARFGIATCLEELDQLDAAFHQFESLRTSYPSPQVIEIKLSRIRERKAQRSR